MTDSDQLFSELLYLLHHNAFSALDNMKKSKDHSSELVNVRKLIDMVVMLKEKTTGNLSEEIDQIQNMMLSELESKYMEKINKLSDNESA